MARETKTGGRDATVAVIPGKAALSVGKPALPEPQGFRWVELATVARLESGHTPSRNHPEYWEGGIPWIGLRDATGNHGRIIERTDQQVSELGVENSSTRVLPAGTVCLSRTASVGYVVQMGVPMCTSQDFVNWVCGPALDPNYLRYLLMSEQETVRRIAYGTTHQTMYYPDAKALNVLLPSRNAQAAIAEFLGAFDNKVEANERLAAAADRLASALAHQGLVSTSPLGDAAELLMGTSPSGASMNERREGVAFFQGVRDFGTRVPKSRVFTVAPTKMAAPGDVLISVRAPVGSVNRTDSEVCIGRGLAALRSSTPSVLFHALRLAPVWEAFNGEGTVFGSISQKDLRRVEIPWSSGSDIERLERVLSPIEARIDRAEAESARLADLRDALLPHLMSGRITVREAEKAVEEVL